MRILDWRTRSRENTNKLFLPYLLPTSSFPCKPACNKFLTSAAGEEKKWKAVVRSARYHECNGRISKQAIEEISAGLGMHSVEVSQGCFGSCVAGKSGYTGRARLLTLVLFFALANACRVERCLWGLVCEEQIGWSEGARISLRGRVWRRRGFVYWRRRRWIIAWFSRGWDERYEEEPSTGERDGNRAIDMVKCMLFSSIIILISMKAWASGWASAKPSPVDPCVVVSV